MEKVRFDNPGRCPPESSLISGFILTEAPNVFDFYCTATSKKFLRHVIASTRLLELDLTSESDVCSHRPVKILNTPSRAFYRQRQW